MRRMPFLLFALLTITPFMPFVPVPYSYAGCANRGDTMAMVLNNCGEPTWVDTREEWRMEAVLPGTIIDGWYVATQSRVIRVRLEVEQWTYNLGRTKFMRIFAFENGILVSINTGGYGH